MDHAEHLRVGTILISADIENRVFQGELTTEQYEGSQLARVLQTNKKKNQ